MSGLMRKFLEGSSAHRDLDGEIRDGASVKATIRHSNLRPSLVRAPNQSV